MNSFRETYEAWLQKMLLIKKNKIWILITMMICIIIAFAWNSDDAYHAYVMARNLARGKGFVYYPGYRVNATTCPLYTLLVALLSVVGMETNIAGVLINIIASSSAIVIVNYFLCGKFFWALLFDIVLVCNYSFLCFTSAGLENSMAFLLVAVFICVLDKTNDYTFCGKDLLILSGITGLIALTRMDLLLLVFPTLLYVFFKIKEMKLLKKVLIGLAGMIPFLAWEIFSVIYYGFLFPNTFYSKLNSGYSLLSYVQRGILYFFDSVGVGITVLMIPLLLFIMAAKEKNAKSFSICMGICVYTVYTIIVGGDFMLGRFLTVPFFTAVCESAVLLRNISSSDYSRQHGWLSILICVIVFSTLWTSTIGSLVLYNLDGKVADERSIYSKHSGIEAYIDGKVRGIDYKEDFFYEWYLEAYSRYEEGMHVCQLEFIPGMLVYFSQDKLPDMYMFDIYGLMDPLITQLPGREDASYRTGHIKRDIPKGYIESLENGTNQIEDPEIAELYDKIKLITTGAIWDSTRWRYIWELMF